jgi:hypothetical protein
MNRGPSVAEIKDALQARALELARDLAPGGSIVQGVYQPLNPTRNDRNPGSFCIWLHGDGAGAFKDYATGDKGDIIGLIAYCLRIDAGEAIAWGKRWCGLDSGGATVPARKPIDAAELERRRLQEEANAATKRTQRIAGARAMWLNAKLSIVGTPAETYLRTRGIDISLLLRLVPSDRKRQPLNALRFEPACWYDKLQSFPAIVSCMQTEGAGIVAVHRTYLAPDGSGKAPVTPARKMFGPAQGAAIAVWRGQSALPVKEANAHGIADTLVLTEGIEDALSVAISAPDFRVWAVGSLGNLRFLKLPACAHDVIVFADNDWTKPEAEAEFKRGLAALAEQNKRVKVARSSSGKDANDLLNAGAAA